MNTPKTFGRFARLLHWVMAALIIGLFALGLWMRSLTYYDPWYNAAPNLHTSFGMVFLFLVAVRIIWRATTKPPPLLGDSNVEHALAKLVHVLLYVLMIAVALTGYLYASAEGKPASVFQLFELPVLIQSKPLADRVSDLHEWLAYAIIAIMGLHVVGALKHHIIDRDDTLRRMTTGRTSHPKTRSNTDAS